VAVAVERKEGVSPRTMVVGPPASRRPWTERRSSENQLGREPEDEVLKVPAMSIAFLM